MTVVYILVLLLIVALLPLPFELDTAYRLKKIQYHPLQVTVYERGQSRLAIVEPFGWTFLNLNSTIYIFEQVPGSRCKQMQTGAIILTIDMGYDRPNFAYQCYNATTAALCSIFKNSPHESLALPTTFSTTETISLMSVINFLLAKGLFKGS